MSEMTEWERLEQKTDQRLEMGRLKMEEHGRRLAVLEDRWKRMSTDVKDLVEEAKAIQAQLIKDQITAAKHMAKTSLVIGLLGALGGAAVMFIGRLLLGS